MPLLQPNHDRIQDVVTSANPPLSPAITTSAPLFPRTPPPASTLSTTFTTSRRLARPSSFHPRHANTELYTDTQAPSGHTHTVTTAAAVDPSTNATPPLRPHPVTAATTTTTTNRHFQRTLSLANDRDGGSTRSRLFAVSPCLHPTSPAHELLPSHDTAPPPPGQPLGTGRPNPTSAVDTPPGSSRQLASPLTSFRIRAHEANSATTSLGGMANSNNTNNFNINSPNVATAAAAASLAARTASERKISRLLRKIDSVCSNHSATSGGGMDLGGSSTHSLLSTSGLGVGLGGASERGGQPSRLSPGVSLSAVDDCAVLLAEMAAISVGGEKWQKESEESGDASGTVEEGPFASVVETDESNGGQSYRHQRRQRRVGGAAGGGAGRRVGAAGTGGGGAGVGIAGSRMAAAAASGGGLTGPTDAASDSEQAKKKASGHAAKDMKSDKDVAAAAVTGSANGRPVNPPASAQETATTATDPDPVAFLELTLRPFSGAVAAVALERGRAAVVGEIGMEAGRKTAPVLKRSLSGGTSLILARGGGGGGALSRRLGAGTSPSGPHVTGPAAGPAGAGNGGRVSGGGEGGGRKRLGSPSPVIAAALSVAAQGWDTTEADDDDDDEQQQQQRHTRGRRRRGDRRRDVTAPGAGAGAGGGGGGGGGAVMDTMLRGWSNDDGDDDDDDDGHTRDGEYSGRAGARAGARAAVAVGTSMAALWLAGGAGGEVRTSGATGGGNGVGISFSGGGDGDEVRSDDERGSHCGGVNMDVDGAQRRAGPSAREQVAEPLLFPSHRHHRRRSLGGPAVRRSAEAAVVLHDGDPVAAAPPPHTPPPGTTRAGGEEWDGEGAESADEATRAASYLTSPFRVPPSCGTSVSDGDGSNDNAGYDGSVSSFAADGHLPPPSMGKTAVARTAAAPEAAFEPALHATSSVPPLASPAPLASRAAAAAAVFPPPAVTLLPAVLSAAVVPHPAGTVRSSTSPLQLNRHRSSPLKSESSDGSSSSYGVVQNAGSSGYSPIGGNAVDFAVSSTATSTGGVPLIPNSFAMDVMVPEYGTDSKTSSSVATPPLRTLSNLIAYSANLSARITEHLQRPSATPTAPRHDLSYRTTGSYPYTGLTASAGSVSAGSVGGLKSSATAVLENAANLVALIDENLSRCAAVSVGGGGGRPQMSARRTTSSRSHVYIPMTQPLPDALSLQPPFATANQMSYPKYNVAHVGQAVPHQRHAAQSPMTASTSADGDNRVFAVYGISRRRFDHQQLYEHQNYPESRHRRFTADPAGWSHDGPGSGSDGDATLTDTGSEDDEERHGAMEGYTEARISSSGWVPGGGTATTIRDGGSTAQNVVLQAVGDHKGSSYLTLPGPAGHSPPPPHHHSTCIQDPVEQQYHRMRSKTGVSGVRGHGNLEGVKRRLESQLAEVASGGGAAFMAPLPARKSYEMVESERHRLGRTGSRLSGVAAATAAAAVAPPPSSGGVGDGYSVGFSGATGIVR